MPPSQMRPPTRYRRHVVLRLGAVGLLCGACAGDQRPAAQDSTGTLAPASPPATVAPGAAAASPSVGGEGAPPAPLLALGDSVFHGLAGGALCATCHGANGEGSALGPDLRDGSWLHGDGSYASIVEVVTTGIAQPKQYASTMPPMGGGQLTPEQVRAVAAYVQALGGRPTR